MGGWKRDLLSPPFPASKRMFCILFLHSPEVNGPLLFSDTKTPTDAVIAKAVILPPLIQFFLPFLPLSPAQQPVWRNSLPGEHKNVPREASYPSLTGHEEAVREPQVGAPREPCGMRAPESGTPATTPSPCGTQGCRSSLLRLLPGVLTKLVVVFLVERKASSFVSPYRPRREDAPFFRALDTSAVQPGFVFSQTRKE